MTNARFRPKRSPILLLIRMNAAETSASIATAACTPLTVVSRSCTTAEIETFMNDVSMTKTNIAIASSTPRRGVPDGDAEDMPAVSPTHRRQGRGLSDGASLLPAACGAREILRVAA